MWINNAYAQFGGGGADSGLSSIIMMVGMFGVLWFVIRKCAAPGHLHTQSTGLFIGNQRGVCMVRAKP